MRRLACLALCGLALSGCQYASSPFSGFGGFIGDTHTFRRNPNLPPGNAENIRRVQGQQVVAEPLSPEPGNIWPGPPKAEATLEDLIREEQPDRESLPPQPLGQQPASPTRPPEYPGVPPASGAHPQPRPTPPGSGGTPPPVTLRPQPTVPRVTQTPPGNIVVPPATIDTPNGVQPLTRGGNGVTTTTAPGGGTSIVVPNGNGTSTIINPDGTTSTVATPR